VTRTAYALLGPTASGKSQVAIELARRLPVEVVSLDSAQVYRGLDIGTAKPGAAERAAAPHHLIDLVDPDQSYSSGRWRAEAIRVISDILERKKIPLVVGGTMLYYRTLIGGLDPLPQADPALRAEIDAEAARCGWPALHAELERIDPRGAHRISRHDSQRIQRALEVWRLTGKPLSALQGGSQQQLPFQLKGFAILPQREALHERIARRFDSMLAAGLIAEVEQLRQRHRLTAAMPSMRAVGYRQVWEYLEGAIDEAQLRSRAVAATRQLAKRQFTWLRSFREVERIEPDAEIIRSSILRAR
jgi:tRNA dimethylallyltransferase